MRLWRWLVFQVRWWRWFLRPPYRFGDPLLGQGEVREKNRQILNQRYWDSEPKP